MKKILTLLIILSCLLAASCMKNYGMAEKLLADKLKAKLPVGVSSSALLA